MGRSVFALAWLVGCYSPVVPTNVPCGQPGDVCPNGQMCIAGYCEGAPSDGSIDTPDGFVPSDWSTPTRIAELSSASDDFGASLTADGLQLFFNSNRVGGFKLYVATRTDVTQPFGTPTVIAELDPAGIEYDPEVSTNGLELHYITLSITPAVRHSTRVDRMTAWTAPTNPMMGAAEGPTLGVNDTRLLLTNYLLDQIEEFSRATPTDPWTMVRTHGALDNMSWAGLSSDGLEVFAIRTLGMQLYTARRNSVDEGFGDAVRVTLTGGFNNDMISDPELTADGKTMYLSIDIGNGQGYDIYTMTRP